VELRPKFRDDRSSGSEICSRTDKTDRQTDGLITILRTPTVRSNRHLYADGTRLFFSIDSSDVHSSVA